MYPFRFDRSLWLIRVSLTVGPPIAMGLPDGLSILDGNHLLTAFCGLQQTPVGFLEKYGLQKPLPEQELWIGTHSRGEVPLDYAPDV